MRKRKEGKIAVCSKFKFKIYFTFKDCFQIFSFDIILCRENCSTFRIEQVEVHLLRSGKFAR